ncbi:bifunctional DNA-formamidopyrimidine glycosylase/DNA-(apurinic or apyrimidinic site) lyase [soil metagenome]
MPELPEVETIRLGLHPRLVGSSIVDVIEFDFPGVVEPLSIAQFRDAVRSRTFTNSHRRGKYLIFDLDDGLSLIVHLRMTGQLLLVKADHPETRFARLCLALNEGRELRFADQRKFGRVTLADVDAIKELDRKLGIEPLGSRFTAAWLESALSSRSGAIKAVLLDQSLIAGIGNIYADEALYRAAIHPLTPASSLDRRSIAFLHRSVRFVLRQSINRHGTSFSSYRDSEGNAGTNQYSLQVYGLGRKYQPCRRCGTELICIQVAGRSSHVCARCQRF